MPLQSLSVAFRAARMKTEEMLADKDRLEFLRGLNIGTLDMTTEQIEMVAAIRERILIEASKCRYHYQISHSDRILIDNLKRKLKS